MDRGSQMHPKVFISYSWTTPDHEAWVIRFAEELRSQAVDVILDKWDLREGHDANVFMEQMVSREDIKK
ncbi:TIR domain-containing protein [Methylobacterium sp. WL103]|nr:TIR domain-containing protein [Methylobacterium sp. WL103]